MPADGYNGKDIIEIGKDLAVKHPEIKDYTDEERLKHLEQLGVDYEMEKLKKDLSDFNVHFDGLVKHLYMKMARLKIHYLK